MKKILLFCIGVFLIFSVLERENISLVIANGAKNMAWYQGKNQEVHLYNEALWLTRSGKYPEAMSVLAPLLDAHDLVRGADIFELSGDLLYRTWGSTGEILTLYRRSRELSPTPRIEQKIVLLSTSPEQHSGSTLTNTPPVNTPEDQTGANLRATRRQELLDANLDRKESINLDTTLPQNTITRTLELLQTGTVIKDW